MKVVILLLLAFPCWADTPPVNKAKVAVEFLGPKPAIVIAPKAEPLSPVHGVEERNPLIFTHRFYDKPAKVLLVSAVALAAADTAQTCRNLARGGQEHGMPASNCAQANFFLFGQVAVQEGVAYLLHRTGLHGLERVSRLFSISLNTKGLIQSKQAGAW
jgi:hypothetical protein